MAEVNPCHVDRERRERASRDDTLTEHFGEMSRSITFQVGYDHRAFPEACGGGGHGQSGMKMRWMLIGPHGAVQWVMSMTNWVPGNVIRQGDVANSTGVSLVPANHRFGDGMATDLGYHSPVEHYEDQPQMKCEYLPEGYCYYDGSGLNAGPVLEAFLAHGPHAVWAAQSRYYTETFPPQTGRTP